VGLDFEVSVKNFLLLCCTNLFFSRFLDPASLLTAAGTSSYWSSVCKGDPVLKATVRRQMMVERERYLNEMLNPGLSIIVPIVLYCIDLKMHSSQIDEK
jgi:hypothetical protein